MTRKHKDADEAALAQHYNSYGVDESEWGEPEPITVPARRQVTLSVRFSDEEIATIRQAAQRAGVKPTAFIRARALASLTDSGASVSRKALDKAIAALVRDVDRLREAAHTS